MTGQIEKLAINAACSNDSPCMHECKLTFYSGNTLNGILSVDGIFFIMGSIENKNISLYRDGGFENKEQENKALEIFKQHFKYDSEKDPNVEKISFSVRL